ncbi:MAG: response regulator transcription factor [Candidatus Eremiobacteraeota bacterium]|nr:response regulator transcription factor [Candidatus Eremiobacteraeota bacterium]
MLEILIVDDHPVVRKGMMQILADLPGGVKLDEASKGSEAMEKVTAHRYDVVLLDISLPDIDGLNVLSQIRETCPRCPVLILSILPEEMFAVRALKAGATGYLTKESAPEELLKAVEKVASGGRYISPTVAEIIAGEIEAGSRKPDHEDLSRREFQIMCEIAEGKKPKNIAAELGLSVKTINTYRFRILEKLHLKNNADIIRYVLAHRISCE